MPGIINTTRSIYQTRPAQMPDTSPQFAPGPDAIEEDEPDREGNTDPGTNVWPEEDTGDLFPDDPEVIRKNALAQAHARIKADAFAAAEVALPPPEVMADPGTQTRIQFFDLRKVGETMVHFHLTAIGSNGQQYVITGDLPVSQNTIADAIVLLQRLGR
jgi:hypothetical protein